MDISVIIPVFNEEENIKILYCRLIDVFFDYRGQYELIFVDDGSRDNSLNILKNIAYHDSSVKVICFDKNYGQTSALDAGFKNSKGEIILTIDADLQYYPNDLIHIVKELQHDNSVDVVLGRRIRRKSGFIRSFSSKVAILLRNSLLKENYQTCAFAGYRKRCFSNFKLYNGLQYFIPVLLKMEGCKYKEIDVTEFPRKYGRSKYNNIIRRAIEGMRMLYVVKWMKDNNLKYRVTETYGE